MRRNPLASAARVVPASHRDTGSSRQRHWRTVIRAFSCAIALTALSGCVFKTVREQIAHIDATCSITGQLSDEQGLPGPYVVGLVRADEGEGKLPWRLVDFVTLERGGAWRFTAIPGDYGVVAFRDLNANQHFDAGEPILGLDDSRKLSCTPGATHHDISLLIPEDGTASNSLPNSVPVKRSGPPATLGQVTVFGEVATLDDARFDPSVARNSLWRPYDFVRTGNGGLYFLEAYDPKKIPVLFVHGINGSPREFAPIIAKLDRKRFQPWLYYYASGLRMDTVADHLTQTLQELEIRYGVRTLNVVAHSMGGLIARGFLLRREDPGVPTSIPLFITLSTPWDGHAAAARGVRAAPTPVPVWHDMAPDSTYLQSLFPNAADKLTPTHANSATVTAHHLFFSFRRQGGSGEANDGVVTVASQLRPEAQAHATRLYGIDDTHTGILTNALAIDTVTDLLENSLR